MFATTAIANRVRSNQLPFNLLSSSRELDVSSCSLDIGNPNRLSQRCASIDSSFPTWARTNHRMWFWAEYSYYNHILTPNAHVVDCGDGLGLPVGVFSARSYHRGMVNVLFADGKVQQIPDSVDLQVWRQLGTRADGSVASVHD